MAYRYSQLKMVERVHFYIHKSCYQKKWRKRNYIKITLNFAPVKFPIEVSIGIKGNPGENPELYSQL